MKKFLYLFLFCISTVYSQNTLSGHISQKENNLDLEGVNIFIPDLQKGAISDNHGNYTLISLPEGQFNIQFSYVGYKTEVRSINISKNKLALDVEMIPSNIKLNEVVVLANSIRSQEKIPYKIETISKENIELNGQITLTQSLSLLPGISELSNGIGLSKPVIRGLYGYRIAAVVNGVRFDNQQWQDEHSFGLDEVGADRIEIIEGPASLLYGAQALGGVVKVENETNAPIDRVIGNYNLQIFSNTLGAITEAGLKGSNNKLSWQIHVRGQSHADYLAGGDERVPNTRFASLGAAGLLSYNSSWGLTSLNYNFSRQINGVVEPNELNNPNGKKEEHFEREFEGPHHIVDSHVASLNHTFFLTGSKLKLNVGFQNNHREEAEGEEEDNPEMKQNELDVLLNTISYDAEWVKPFSEKTVFTIGTQGYFQSNENEGGRILIPNAEMNELSLFSYLRQNIGNVDIDAGLRFDSKNITTDEMGIPDSMEYFTAIDQSYKTVNGAIGAAYSASENLIFKVNFASGYRAPNLAELTSNGVHEGTVRYELGEETLKSEKSFQTDFGINFQNENLNINLSAFYNKINDFIFLQPTDIFIQNYRVYQFLQTNVNLKGGELSADLNLLNWLAIGGSYSTVIGKKSNDSYLPFMPADKIIGKIKLHWKELSSLRNFYFNIILRSYLKQDKISGEETATPAYSLVDIGVGSTVELFNLDFDLALNAVNLLDKKYYNHLSLLKPLGILNMGRNISFALNVPFTLK